MPEDEQTGSIKKYTVKESTKINRIEMANAVTSAGSIKMILHTHMKGLPITSVSSTNEDDEIHCPAINIVFYCLVLQTGRHTDTYTHFLSKIQYLNNW